MPKITITKAFNHHEGGEVKHYPKTEKPVDVPQAVAEHAWAHGFAPKSPAKTSAAAAAAPASSTEPTGAQ